MNTAFFEEEPEEDTPDREPGYGTALIVLAIFLAILAGCVIAIGAVLTGGIPLE